MHPSVNKRSINKQTIGKTYHLKAAWISQKCAWPVHEFVKPAHWIQQVSSRSQRQVISVSKDNLTLQILQLIVRQPLYGAWSQHASYYSSGLGMAVTTNLQLKQLEHQMLYNPNPHHAPCRRDTNLPSRNFKIQLVWEFEPWQNLLGQISLGHINREASRSQAFYKKLHILESSS
jgi:hypothetical protein